MLAGCVAGPRVDGFRKPGVPIWSAAAFDAGRIGGAWRQVASFATGAAPGCPAGGLTVGEGLSVTGRLCLNGETRSLSGRLVPAGPGRLSLPGMEDWWVIWVDEGYRTLAVATPSGRFGFVLDRGAIPPDRLRAAAEVFDFNGYGTGRMRGF